MREKLTDMDLEKYLRTRFETVAADFENKVNELHKQLFIYRELLQERKSEAPIYLKKLECKNIQKELKISWKLWKDMVEHFDHQYVLLEH